MNPEEQKQTEEVTPIVDPEVPNYGTTQPTTDTPSVKHGMLGPVIGIIVVALVFILGGLYLWGTTLKQTEAPALPAPAERPTAEENNEPESTTAEAEVETAAALSPSDTIEAIEADVEATSELDAIDTELNAIEAELDAALEDL